MLFLLVLAVALGTVRLAGGRLETLSRTHLRGVWLVVTALLLQVVTISLLVDPPHLLAASLHVLSYVVAAAFLWQNRRLLGLSVIAGGAFLNALAILANGGTMPARAAALRSSGIVQPADHFANSTALPGAHLRVLGDVFAVPASAGIFANVFSLGDLLLAGGVVLLLHAAAGCPWTGVTHAPAAGPHPAALRVAPR